MLILILAFIVSMIPTVLLFLWIRGQKNIAENYNNNCTKAFVRGLLSVLPVIPTSLVLNIAVNLTGFKESNPVLYQALYTFLVLAFSEELMKFLMMKGVIKGGKHSWYEIAAFMTLVGLGFELIEAIPYAIGADPMTMFVRGLTVMHGGYGFITGYFYGKSVYTGNKAYGIFGFCLSWILHGLYDFGLSEELLAVDDDLAFIAITLAAISLVFLVLLVRFFKKRRTDEKYLSI